MWLQILHIIYIIYICIYIYIIVSSFIMFNLVSKLSQASSVLKKAHKKRRKQHKTLVNPSATSRHNSPMTEGGIAMGTLSSTKSEPHRRYFEAVAAMGRIPRANHGS